MDPHHLRLRDGLADLAQLGLAMDLRTLTVSRLLDYTKHAMEEMKMHGLDKMMVTVDKTKVLEALKKNRDQHQAVVKEAREGYVRVAREQLEAEMKKLEAGKPVRIAVHLELPMDNTRVYDTAIEMLEAHTEETVKLDSSQFRTLVMNKWDWMDQFVHHNATYSHTAAGMMPGGEDN